jgi:hypothetical protein
MARSVFGAIADRVDATPALAALLPGGVTLGMGESNRAIPYATMAVAGRENAWNTGSWHPRRTYVRLSVFADSPDTLEQIGQAWGQVFKPGMAPLDFDDGGHGTVHSGPMQYVGEDETPTGTPLHHGMLDMDILTDHAT